MIQWEKHLRQKHSVFGNLGLRGTSHNFAKFLGLAHPEGDHIKQGLATEKEASLDPSDLSATEGDLHKELLDLWLEKNFQITGAVGKIARENLINLNRRKEIMCYTLS